MTLCLRAVAFVPETSCICTLKPVVFVPATHGRGELQTGLRDPPIMDTLRELHARVEAGTVEILKK